MRPSLGLSVPLTAAAVLALLTACSGPDTPNAPPAPTSTPATAQRTTVAVPSSVQEIPGQPPVVHYGTVDDPETGVAYEYHLYVHCGIRAAKFGGRWWLAAPPTDQRYEGGGMLYLDGAMTLVATDRARFEWADGSADFTPTGTEPTPCA